ncbi:glycosyltransferase [Christiangramia sabulilitoris]|uniref:Glycosyltransferase n=1 Tax=Christiangramia sabulilitoris TaxID=2583991 RepID=A0A550I2B0_9FLAO|nr:glycosyltransferase [Christiangramia sabulilitoris]TRO65113.1 glycosyltransferase [Christiangramia sabulilitoris]
MLSDETSPKKIKPLISVCMITYRHENYLEQAVESILMQEGEFEMELVISNDNSPDKTAEIVKRLIANHNKGNCIKYFCPEKNLGVTQNLIFALKQCQGKYIAICEGDDFWTDETKLQKQIEFLENHEDYVVTYHDALVVNENGEVLKDSKLPASCRKDFTQIELMKGAYLLFLSICFRNIIEDYPREIYSVSTPDVFITSLLGNYGKGKYLPFIQKAGYRLHGGGVWGKKAQIKKLEMRLSLFKSLNSFYRSKDREVSFYYSDRISGTLRPIIFEYAKSKNWEAFINYCKLYFKHVKGIKKVNSLLFIQKMFLLFIIHRFLKN